MQKIKNKIYLFIYLISFGVLLSKKRAWSPLQVNLQCLTPNLSYCREREREERESFVTRIDKRQE